MTKKRLSVKVWALAPEGVADVEGFYKQTFKSVHHGLCLVAVGFPFLYQKTWLEIKDDIPTETDHILYKLAKRIDKLKPETLGEEFINMLSDTVITSMVLDKVEEQKVLSVLKWLQLKPSFLRAILEIHYWSKHKMKYPWED